MDKDIQETEKRNIRLMFGIKKPENKIFLYESSPCDWYEGMKAVFNACYHFYNEEINDPEDYFLEYGGDARKMLKELELLTVRGLTNFSEYFIGDYRETRLYYFYHREEIPGKSEFECRNYPVVVYKADNNGTCYAFTYSPHMKKMPHDFSDEWELKDVRNY